MKLFLQYLILYGIIWIFSLLDCHDAQNFVSKDDRNCNIEIDRFINLQPKETLTFNLSRSNLTETYDLHKCQMKVKLQHKFSDVYSYSRRYNIKLQVSMVTFNSCLYNIDIYIGDSSRNEPITTLDCTENTRWTGHWPSREVILRYKYPISSYASNESDYTMINVKFSSCKGCYRTTDLAGYKRKHTLNKYNSKDICLDDSYNEYENPYSAFCGSVTFSVIEDVPVCFRFYDPFSSFSKLRYCSATVEINKKRVLDIEYNMWREWCIPWELKNKLVTFNIEKRGRAYICSCKLFVKTNTKKTKGSCPRPTMLTTTTRGWIDWSSNGDDDTSLDSDMEDNNYTEVIASVAALAIVGMFCCFCFSGACRNRSDDDDNNVDANQGNERPPLNIYQMKTMNGQRPNNPVIPSAPSYYSNTIRSPEQNYAQGSQYHRYRLLQQTSDGRTDQTFNDSSGATGTSRSYHTLDGYQNRPLTDASSDSDSQTVISPHVDQFRSRTHSDIRPEIEDGDSIDELPLPPSYQEALPPPPSYQEVCANQMYYK